MRKPLHLISMLGPVLCLAVLAGCGRLPSTGPVVGDVVNGAGESTADFAVYPVTRAFLPTITQWPATGEQQHLPWLRSSEGPRQQLIQPGDILTIRIWDSSDNSLLTAPEQKNIALDNMKVAANGTVYLPYVGTLSVTGKTEDLAREEMQTALEKIIPSAQVLVSLTEGRYNSVDLVGGVSSPGTYPMPDRNYTVMSLLAAGGGVRESLNNPQIRLMRSGRLYGTSVETLLEHPSLDTRLSGGDRVFVEEDGRYFLSFGATGRQAQHIFPRDEVSAMDAVSIMGGIAGGRADPKGLLILREYPASAISAGVRGPRQTRVVFTVDLTSADGLFSARKFAIQPQDLIVATESPINDVLTISNIVGGFFGVFNRANSAVN
jgi:polysaccharide export outer membrane protein